MSDLSRNFPADAIEGNISISKRLRLLLPEIEELSRKGIPRRMILEYLNSNGFSLSMDTYATILKRWRKDVRSKSSVALVNESSPITTDKADHPVSDGYVRRVPIVLGQRAKKFEVNPFPSGNWLKAEDKDNE
ncbi:hypothetical protein GTP23_21395 [Pseudoduganella sp. FT93W]|uniref:Uncharacterized protein n=1 Tax=Duganella fentianensis TaxID=2692177 RepID=A0A845I215_9BURK|nr:hypothetical protein [Duganella fentianensis]MYN47604.1 hypothetical protein [Duganella fentianensis]